MLPLLAIALKLKVRQEERQIFNSQSKAAHFSHFKAEITHTHSVVILNFIQVSPTHFCS